MNDKTQFSDEYLNAYLDNELASSDKVRLIRALRSDEELSRRLCQLQRVKNMVQLAYHDIQPPRIEQPVATEKQPTQVSRYAIAASILLVIGVFAGWLAHTHFQKPGLTEIVQELRTNTPTNGNPWKLIVQVSSNDQHRYNVLMDETERLLKTARSNNEQVVIQLLANSKGIDLLKNDNSPVSLRMRQLSRQYNNLILTACGQTLKKLKLNNKPIPQLLDDTKVVQSALHEAIQKQKAGWTFIKI
ncbi:MAG: hypothetical protein OEY52_06915 [Gammaproteobacteria bacterium]|nr:hypothetical protein [Gammaproteobacteria bacterium]